MNKEKQDVEPSADLLAKVSQKLDVIEDEKDSSTPELESQLSQAESEDSILDDGDKTLAEDKKGDEDTPQPLPDNYFRAAIHQGWSPEEIQELYSQNPEVALKTFEKIYESTNYITKQTADLGRKHKQLTEKLVKSETSPTTSKSEVQELNVEEFKKKYPDADEFVIDLVGQLSKQNKVLYDKVQSLETQQKVSNEPSDEDKKVWNIIVDFFSDNALTQFKDFYGVAKSNDEFGKVLTGQQLKNRMEVVELADQVLSGAALQGKDMDYAEALHLAHLYVSDVIREKVIRDEIKSKITARSKGITVKSSGGKVPDDGTITPEKLEKKVASRLGKLFKR